MTKTIFFLFNLLILPSLISAQIIISAPAGERYCSINQAGTTIIPNGRLITPSGKCFTVAPHPYGLVISNDGNIAITANSGISPLSITILRNIQSDHPEIQQIPPGNKSDKGILESVFMGLAISHDNKYVYVAGGQQNKVLIFDVKSGTKTGEIDCSFKDEKNDYSDGYIGDMVMNEVGTRIYAVDQIGFRVLVIDPINQKLLTSIPVGLYPFGITLSSDEKQVFVANVGMFRYSKIKRKYNNLWKDGVLDYPAFAFGSEEAEKGISNDSISVPGLGPINSDESFSVWAIDVQNLRSPKIIAKIKTGNLVGQKVDGIPAVGGSSPNSMVATRKYIFCSNGNNDNISVIDLHSRKIVKNITLYLDDRLKKWRGIIPFGLAVSPDQSLLFVAESGINSIGIIDIQSLKLIGHIPTAWFPAKIKVTPDGKKIVVANAKGFGSGPNGGNTFNLGSEGSYIGSLMKGTVEVIDIPSKQNLALMTQKVLINNFDIKDISEAKFENQKNNPVPLYPGQKASPIKHIIFISKENRTFDEVFGQVKKAEGDSTIARFGYNVSFTNRSKTNSVDHATVMPNHLKLAKQFSISDNFYVDADVSADGHRWLANTYPNEWVESTTPANYGGNRSYREKSNAPGNLAFTGSAGAIYPEDYNEAGSLWDHLYRNHIDFFNFGFGVMFEPADYNENYKYMGVKQVANFPLSAPLFSRSSHYYPTFNMAIPDQFRVDMFKKEYDEKWGDGKSPLPSVLTIIIPNDHGAGERPEAGFPFLESYMADNDLAVGRIIEFLSHTSYWKNMAIYITEDDAQSGVDHIDAHRSLLMVVSPYAKRDHISHVHSSFGSIFKTFWNILGIPYLNQFDASASDLSDMFTSIPDFTPYNAINVDQRIFDPAKALSPLNEKFNWKALKDSPVIDNPEDMMRQSKERDEWRDEGKIKK